MNFRYVVAGLTAALATLLAGAEASAAPSRVALEVMGDGASSVREDVSASLGSLESTSAGELRAAVGRGGRRDGDRLSKLLESRAPIAPEDVRRATSSLGARGAIVVRVRRQKSGRDVRIAIVDADSGAVHVVDVSLPTKRSASDALTIYSAVEPSIKSWHQASAAATNASSEPAKAAPPVSKTQTPEPTERTEHAELTPPVEAPIGQRDHATDGAPNAMHKVVPSRELLVLSARFGLAGRKFGYNDKISTALRAYNLDAAPFMKIGAELYPFAERDLGALGDVGITGNYGRALLVTSRPTDGGGEVDTSWQTFDVGARYRLHTGSGALPVIGFGAGYAQTSFELTGTPLPDGAEAPSVRYASIHGGLDARSQIGGFALYGGIGAGKVLSSGSLERRFPRASTASVDAELGLAYRFVSNLEIRGSVSYARFFSKLNPEPGDPLVAGGTLDVHQSAMLGLAYAY